jgi:transposase-like protein
MSYLGASTIEVSEPKTLQEATVFFANPDNCVSFLVTRRWPDGMVKCTTCGSDKVAYVPTRRVWQCKTRHPKCQFSIKVGTIFEDSTIALDKWLMAMWMMANCRNGVSSHEIMRTVGVTQKSAWFMMHRIRLAMREDHGALTMGTGHQNPIEVDETFIGGKPKNKHVVKRQQTERKTVVMGMLNRETRQIRAKVIPNAKRETLQAEILNNVGFNAHVYTDGWMGYNGLDAYKNFTHKTVNHINEYVNGRVHTQGIENFWSLLKRGLTGTYVAVEPFHLDRYVDEQVFRYNNRIKKTDSDRFNLVVSQIVGKRLTYEGLTGKVADRQAETAE